MLVVVALLGGRSAAAEEAPVTPPAPSSGYTLPVIAADLAAIGLAAGGYATLRHYEDCACEEFASGYLMLFGVGAYLSSPAIHHHHGRLEHGLAAGALRLVLPVVGALVARSIRDDRTATFGGAVAGVATAMAVDWAVLTRW